MQCKDYIYCDTYVLPGVPFGHTKNKRNQGLSIKWKKKLHGCQKKGHAKFELHNGDVKTKPIQKFYYLSNIVRGNRKYNTEIRRTRGRAKDDFQKLNKVKKERKMSLETKQRSLNFYAISSLAVLFTYKWRDFKQ